jgi:antitoxin (DNA-binding transcriptional repressor) of toxin-antitoxin stability system
VARLIPYRTSATAREPGLWRGRVEMSADFDAPDEELLAAFEQ